MARYCLVWVHLVLNCYVCPTQIRLLLNQKEKVGLIFALNVIYYFQDCVSFTAQIPLQSSTCFNLGNKQQWSYQFNQGSWKNFQSVYLFAEKVEVSPFDVKSCDNMPHMVIFKIWANLRIFPFSNTCHSFITVVSKKKGNDQFA